MRLLVLGKLSLATVVMIGFIGACGKSDDKTSGSRTTPREVSGLAGDLTRAKDFKSAVQATQTALARGGIAVAQGDQIVVSSVGPAASVSFSPGEAYSMALEARHRATSGRMTLGKLGDMLYDLGWPFEGGPLPGEQLAQFLKVWVTEARKDPKNPHNFTPLFLADMAQAQVPAVDLAKGEYSPEELRLTLLELHLIAAAFDRALGPKEKPLSLPRWIVPSVAYAQGDPCSRWKDRMSKAYGDLTKGTTELASVALNEAVEKLWEAGGEYGKKFGDALSALSIAAKLWKLAELYSYNEFTVVVASNNPMHKPLKGQENKEAAFTARAGLNEKDWEEYQKMLIAGDFMRVQRDCLAELGFPKIPDQGDVAKDSKKWRVEWRLLPHPEVEKHAYIDVGREKNPEMLPEAGGMRGQLQMNLTKSQDNEHSSTATLAVDILPEKYEHKGIEKKTEVTAEATLETSDPPALSTLVSAFKGGKGVGLAVGAGELVPIGAILGITSALVEVCAGWFQEMAEPKAYATLTVTYHEPGVKLHIVDANKVKLDFRGKNRLWIVGGMAAETSLHVYDGGIRLGEDSLWHGQLQVTAKGRYTNIDSAETWRRAAKMGVVDENSSLEDAMKAFVNAVEVLSDLPTCEGTYEGIQTFAVEGSFTSNDAGVPQVELALSPVGPPESYRETPGCRWTKGEIEGIETLPLRIPKGEETALVIDVPKPGEVHTRRDWVKIPDVFGSTVVTVGP
ncbi:MAG: hypothetical protein ACJ8BF_06660 [Gemmatimonadales bacterium]